MRTTFMIGISEAQKEALGTYAYTRGMSAAHVVRLAIAKYIEYDLEGEVSEPERRGRPRIYANDAERQRAARMRRADQRALEDRLLRDYERQQRLADVEQMEDSPSAIRGIIGRPR